MPWPAYSEYSATYSAVNNQNTEYQGLVGPHGRMARAGHASARLQMLDSAAPPYYQRLLGDAGAQATWDLLEAAVVGQVLTVDCLVATMPPGSKLGESAASVGIPEDLWIAFVLTLLPMKAGGLKRSSPCFDTSVDDVRQGLADGTWQDLKGYFVSSIEDALGRIAGVLRAEARYTHFTQPLLGQPGQPPPAQARHAHGVVNDVGATHMAFVSPLRLVPDTQSHFSSPQASDPAAPHADGCMPWSEDALAAATPRAKQLLYVKKWQSGSQPRLSVRLLGSHCIGDVASDKSYAAWEMAAHSLILWSIYGPYEEAPVPAPFGDGGIIMCVHACHDVCCLSPQHLMHGDNMVNAGKEDVATERAHLLLNLRRSGGANSFFQRRLDVQIAEMARLQQKMNETAITMNMLAAANPFQPARHDSAVAQMQAYTVLMARADTRAQAAMAEIGTAAGRRLQMIGDMNAWYA
jgi:hypothetical protein